LSVLLLGDSRSRFTFSHIAPGLCTPSTLRCMSSLCFIHHNFTKLPPDVRVMGEVTCSPSAPLRHLAYFLHYGVSPTGPYHSVPGHQHFGDNLGSHLLMQHAVGWFRRAVQRDLPQSSPKRPLLIVLSSLAWDLGRRMAHFRGQASHDWVREYHHNFSAAARLLRDQLQSHERLLLVAEYGCEHTEGGDDSFCARWGSTEARAAADAVKAVGHQLALPVANLEALFRPRLHELLAKQPATPQGFYYMHPNFHGSCATWSGIQSAVLEGEAPPDAPICTRHSAHGSARYATYHRNQIIH